MRNIAAWCYRRRRAVIAIWVAALVALTVIHAGAGSDFRDSFKLSGTDSADALALLQKSAPKASGDTDRIVFRTTDGSVNTAATKRRVSAMLAKIEKLPHVDGVQSPYTGTGKAQVSKDRTIAYATVTFDDQANELPKDAITKVVDTAHDAAGKTLQVELGGQAIQAANQQGPGGTGIGILAALVVLLIVFGSLLAAVLPILVAGVSLGTGVAIIGLLSNAIQMASFSQELALLIGLGVGVDYALFIVTRFRQELMRGKTVEESAVRALDTSGRAVVFAGITVCIALLGMFTLGVSFLYGVAIATCVVVACTVVAALTLLPALLGFFGTKLLTKKQRRALEAGELTTGDESAGWFRWGTVLGRRPALTAVAAIVVMLAVASPFLDIRLGSSDQGNDPSDTTTRKAYDLLATGFGPGFNGPLQLVAATPDATAKKDFTSVLAAVKKDRDVIAIQGPIPVGKGVLTAQVVPRGSPQDESTSKLVDRLRDTTIPAKTGDTKVLVGGPTAIFADFSSVLSSKLGLFIGVVVALSFLLLMAVFRSLLIPAMAALMNLLSVGAAFGVVVAVFQWGWGAGLIGVDRTGPIEAFLPVMVFAILFGLSMDYEVFLMSRIYEEWHKRGDNRQAVIHGLAATGRTITAAAAIMVLVFAAFVLGGERVIKLFGIGLASAVLLDALVVRSVIIPGLLLMFGKANWFLPAWLDRFLPSLNVEGAPEAGPEDADGDVAVAPSA
ncbi:MMPL family transporter [Patulibacter sp. NPDC049589]|uniref:MMPL family transporter n=1 Tax=Patulibacter sp. NPDC049589 TaxID=3154731 RepID=UPI00344706BC